LDSRVAHQLPHWTKPKGRLIITSYLPRFFGSADRLPRRKPNETQANFIRHGHADWDPGHLPDPYRQLPAQHLEQFDFSGSNGKTPSGGVTADASGNFYGVTSAGGEFKAGVVYEIGPAPSGAPETVLHSFSGSNGDGANPIGDLIFDGVGNLYGVTQFGGSSDFGTVFELSPPSSPGGAWTETVLYSFQGIPSDGAQPVAGLAFDSAGNLYGTTSRGGVDNAYCDGNGGCGTVFELSPPSLPGGAWTETVLCFFQGEQDGNEPMGGVIFDQAGNLYGTTYLGAYNDGNGGTVFELSPPSGPGGAWSETTLLTLKSADGGRPEAGLTLGPGGALFGTASSGGLYGGGTVFKLEPPSSPGGHWSFGAVYNFAPNAGVPAASITFDNPNTLYGTSSGGDGGGVYQISTSGGTVTYTYYYLGTGTTAGVTLYNGALYSTSVAGGH
jgi:uncharacterized repeat protein (TIGR03803 family)